MLDTLKKWITKIDPILFLCTSLLSFISIITIIGAVDNFGMSKLKMQLAMTVVGMILAIVIANINCRLLIDRFWVIMLIFSAFILGITLIFGTSGKNIETTNKSWLEIPIINIAIQPSEFVKFTFICTFARHLYTVRDHVNKPLTLLQLGVHAMIIIGLILLSGDLGVALVFMFAVLIMLFCAGISLWYYLGLAVAVVIASPIIWDHLAVYQRMRIVAGFDPSVDPEKYGWQALLSKQCIENGGFFGRGLFGGGDYEELTASHTDFIYATICEKFGFIGGLAVIVILAAMIIRIFIIAYKSRGDYGFYICVGVAAFLTIQTIENIGMCLAMLPVVGITLPFLSCGGSSMLATFLLIGLVHSVNSHRTKVTAANQL